MGRGDIKSKKGKRWHGSYGKSRPKKGVSPNPPDQAKDAKKAE